MKPGVFGRTYPFQTAAKIFGAAKRDGFAAIQFNLSGVGLPSLPAELYEATLDGLAGAASAAGLELVALSGTYNMANPDRDMRLAGRLGFANVVRAAVLIGAPLVTICTGSRDPKDMWKAHPDNGSDAAWNDMRGELDAALELASRHGLKIGVEPEPGNVVRDARDARRLLDEVGASAPLGIVLDAANLVSTDLPRQSEIMREAMDLLGDALVLAHAKDVDAHDHVTCPGDGEVDLVWFTALLRKAGYDGALVGHGFEATDAARAGLYLAHLIEEIA
ncbi:sugar phosphate isomerase/epimerase [Rhizobium sp. NLR17b]|uniref:sugar phosphate isomerase/epimerase family protein n=1 Tax=Rhizobium sp. NLR17b TaxID=2731114 RepID=UPI001C831EA2|nr:sugar phosphate isomerase/epimerase [Rhizobium sp. NLR17b]MBX5272702.1 sugar phosphate isomerase/epimerase [Rhizobium sp. NLR17b]